MKSGFFDKKNVTQCDADTHVASPANRENS